MKRTLTNATVDVETDARQDQTDLRVRVTVTTLAGETFTCTSILPMADALALFREAR